MKKTFVLFIILAIILMLAACGNADAKQVVATTLPVYDFTQRLCAGTGICVDRLVTENVSCLHDYTMDVKQMRAIEGAEVIILSGAGLEDFLEDALHGKQVSIDASESVHLHGMQGHDHDEHHEHEDDHGHSHEHDPHIWLSPANAKIMAENICVGLATMYPQFADTFYQNLDSLLSDLDALQKYGDESLAELSTRELITFHDGFGYFAESFNLTILEAVEEESGSEASASEIIHLAQLIDSHALPAIFIEESGSDACAGILRAETGTQIYTLNMAMTGSSYFDAMYHNIDTLKEALG